MTALDIRRPSLLRRLMPNWRALLLGAQPAAAEPAHAALDPVTSATDEGENQVSSVYRSEQHEPGQETTALGRFTAEHLLIQPDDGGQTQDLGAFLDELAPPALPEKPWLRTTPNLSTLDRALQSDLDIAEALIYNRLAERWRLAPATEPRTDHTGDMVPLTITSQPEEGA